MCAGSVQIQIPLIKKDLCIFYRLINGTLEVPGVNVLCSPRLPARLQISSVRITLYRSFYLHNTVMIWNKYLSYKHFASFGQFKSFIDELHLLPVCKESALKAL